MKKGSISYVLVIDTIPGGDNIYYYAGYFSQTLLPTNKSIINACVTNEYSKAMKIPFKDEIEEICKEVNKNSMINKFHVEEHMYF